MYDEAKRYAEAITMAYHRTYGVDTKIVRIFNTYGPDLGAADGRVVSNFLAQAMRGEPLTVYGDGKQTRSFCYVTDEVAGLLALLDSDHVGPMNIGNPDEFTMLELAELVLEVTGCVRRPAVRAAARRRPQAAAARHLARRGGPRLASDGRPPRRSRPHPRLVPEARWHELKTRHGTGSSR